jgi:hypothetical protein
MKTKNTKNTKNLHARSAFCGSTWRAVINGKSCVNEYPYSILYSAPYTIILEGHIERAEAGVTMLDIMHQLADHIEAQTKEMGIKDSFQLTLYPATTKEKK